MTPAQWNEALAPNVPWQTAYPPVGEAARAYLAAELAPGDLISTNTLVEALYPAQFARGEGITARRRIYTALAALTKHGLSDCTTKGEPQRMKRTTKYVRPNLWHAPKAKAAATCPHCGGELNA
jgi:hypothetical protein